jgi:hypothetical protein
MTATRSSSLVRLTPLFTRQSLPVVKHRATLRDLYVSGLVSIFRRDSILRIWEPLRETPRATVD